MRQLFYAASLGVAALIATSMIFSLDGEFTTWRDLLGPGMTLTYLVYATPIWLTQVGLVACLERGRRGAAAAATVAVGLAVAGFVGWRIHAAGGVAPDGPPSLWAAVIGGGVVAALVLAAIVAPVPAVRWLAGALPGSRP